ncbi:MAG TPA: flavohemoglobin expression-modulating QEGLA motif protein [Rudaea sp.]|jgi:uncharacterized protein (TIGR02421 family)|nr:flavohemoglobin expression-modulating QEGLA motif protein [Rudaea sp.]
MDVAAVPDGIADLDRRLVAAARGIKLLAALSWPARAQEAFLASWRAKNPQLPKVDYAKSDLSRTREELESIFLGADAGHPLGDYLRRSAQSWRIATELLDAAGTKEVTAHSIGLFGRPHDRLPGGTVSTLDAARHFIELADELGGELAAHEADYCIPADVLEQELQQRLDAFFGAGVVRVETDPDLIAKAAAGAKRIRLRSATCFSEYDKNQLLEHEAFVHSLTALNGRAQPNLGSFATNSPRITATQEGLATFAELMSGSIDIGRMKRISLRILAIDKALNGANFIDVFKFFLDSGQTEADSFASASRVFRGVPPEGGSAFTKDAVYLHGLLSVHTFFRWALKNKKLQWCRNLFAGKMALHDTIALAPWFESGYIAAPTYLPPWMQRANGLAGTLAFSLFANRIRLDKVEAEDLVLGV